MKRRSLRIVATLATLVAVLSCGGADGLAPPMSAAIARKSDSTLLAGLSVSGPVANAGISPNRGAVNASVAPSAEVSYVSLVPGTVADGTTATIANLRTAQRVAVTLVDGGFDPQPIPANVGDTLQVTVSRTGNPETAAYIAVAERLGPRIVRSRPPRGQTDAPLNTIITLVFTEPLDPASVNSTSITLTTENSSVAGTVRVVPGAGYTVEFTPDTLLTPSTTYSLTVRDVANLAGTPLAAPTSVTFTTGSTTSWWPFAETPPWFPGQGARQVLVNHHFVAEGQGFGDVNPLPTTWRSRDPSIATVTPGGGSDGWSVVGEWADVVGVRPGTTVIEGLSSLRTETIAVTVLAPAPASAVSPVVVDYRLLEASLPSSPDWSYAPDLVLRDTTGRGGSAIIGLAVDVPGQPTAWWPCSMFHALGSEPLALGREVFGTFGWTINGRGWRAAGTEAIAHVILRVPGPAVITIDVRGPIVPISFNDPADWFNPPVSGSGEQCL